LKSGYRTGQNPDPVPDINTGTNAIFQIPPAGYGDGKKAENK